ncbi:MAG: TonB-dependent receptor plug domain-containing protein, partial [Candidatus Omnitrophica bacterium]|nr:TonB-dependent receptor plug domain-containing protein [Candidatus Omnitrophota bacterium]
MMLITSRHAQSGPALLCAIFMLFCLASTAWAADDAALYPPAAIRLEPITVTALRSEMLVGRVAENVTIYSAQKLHSLPVHNLDEVLGYVPGVSAGVGSQLGRPSAVSIHGSNSRDVLIMVDDIPFNTQLSGQANPNRIPVDNIERVELIKGASSSAWGSSLGGVVNVVTREVGDSVVPKGSVTNSFGEFASRKDSLDLAGKVGNVGYLFTDSYFTTDGVHFKSPVREDKSFGKLAVPVGDQARLTGSFGYSYGDVREWDAPGGVVNRSLYLSRYGKLRMDLDRPGVDMNLAYKYNDQKAARDVFDAPTGDQLSA